MGENTKIDPQLMLDRLHSGEPLLPPLVIRHSSFGSDRAIDAVLEVAFNGAADTERFNVECKTRSTKEDFRKATQQATENAKRLRCHPLIFLPYLSPDRLAELESMAVSGIDLCGNGIVYVPNRICVVRTGQPNLYPDSRLVANPFRGRSGLVARILIEKPHWETLSELTDAIAKHAQLKGLSLSQVSKTVSAYAEELLVLKDGNTIRLADPIRMLDQLGKNWRSNPSARSHYYRSSKGPLRLSELSNSTKLAWALTGESSATRYCTIAQGGPMKVAVSDMKLAESLLSLTPESVPSFADIVLIETQDDAAFFANEQDDDEVRYASRIQTWIELNAGDARQRETAKDLHQSIINASKA
ncbi:hypothetical protein [Roseiconus lacunae]|uniref:hypothetical protein n=2 Tax=Roseiconus lacunae TaxID=2605694 RepID=UPI00135C9AF7|nr:hypothetical protein [Roseiconus lacunae]